MKPVVKDVIVTVAALATGGLAVGAVFVKSGVYNFAADEPHTAAVDGHMKDALPMMNGEAHMGEHPHGGAAGKETSHPRGGDSNPNPKDAAPMADHHGGKSASGELHGHGSTAPVKR